MENIKRNLCNWISLILWSYKTVELPPLLRFTLNFLKVFETGIKLNTLVWKLSVAVRPFKSLHFGRIPGVMIRREYLTGYWFGEITIFTFLNIQMHFAHILEEPVVASPKTRRSSRIQSQLRLKKCLILRPGFSLLMPSQGQGWGW